MKSKLKVLIIDDSPLVLPTVTLLLADMADDIIIGEARNREEASGLLELVVPDVVLIDLPVKDLIRMISKIKSYHPEVKIIVFTNNTYTNFMSFCLKVGADFFIEKSTEFNLVPLILYEMMADDLYGVI